MMARIYPFSNLFNFAEGPILLLYFQSVFQKDFKFKKRYLFHFIPSLIFFINSSPYLFLDDLPKESFIINYLQDSRVVFSVPTLSFPYFTHIVFRKLQAFLYMVAAAILVYKNFKKHRFSANNAQGYHFEYYCYCFIFGLGFYLMELLVSVNINPEKSGNMLFGSNVNDQISFAGYLNSLFIVSALFYPKLVFEKYFTKKPLHEARLNRKNNSLTESDSMKYDLHEIDRLFGEYIESMPYLKDGFSLNMISDGTKLPVHQISYYIKNRFDLTFNEWKNEQRIKYAVGMINAGMANNLTLESISQKCGYRSRANFVLAFKKVMGITPSEYLASYNKK